MAIQNIVFGKNLRPSTVDALNKINELVAAVNAVDTASIKQIKTDTANLKTIMESHTSDISKLKTDTSGLKQTTSKQTTDIDKIKVTLYTPLSANDSTE